MKMMYILSDATPNMNSISCDSAESIMFKAMENFSDTKTTPYFTQLFDSILPAYQSHIAQCPRCFRFLGMVAEMLKLSENV